MTLDALIMLAGAFVVTLPFLGFPNSWDSALFVIVGMFVIALGIVVRRRAGQRDVREAAATQVHFVERIPTEVAHDRA